MLLQEVIKIYPLLDPPRLKRQASTRVCNILALLTCVAQDDRTQNYLISSNILLYISPFISNNHPTTRAFEFLRLASLGVINTLVQTGTDNVSLNISKTSIVDDCLDLMVSGTPSARKISGFVFQRIVESLCAREYLCDSENRIKKVLEDLKKIAILAVHNPNRRLIRSLITIYLNLSYDYRAKRLMLYNVPSSIMDSTFDSYYIEDPILREKQLTLVHNVNNDALW